jgi:hypothetical protein
MAKRKRRGGKTKYGEPTRKFGGKSYRKEMSYHFKTDATKRKTSFKQKGYLVRMLKNKQGNYTLWVRTSKTKL